MILKLDHTKCTGCMLCEMICSLSHAGECNPTLARVGVITFEKEQLDIPVLCRNCGNPPCMPVCPVEAISIDKGTGAVILNDELCIGCQLCIDACPVEGALTLDPRNGKVLKCDLCDGDPKCIK